MAKWTQDRVRQRLDDLKARLATGQTLEEIARAWGTTKQNVSQFRKKYLATDRLPEVASTSEMARDAVQPLGGRPVNEDGLLYSRAYEMIIARDALIQELQNELRELKYKLHALQQQRDYSPNNAREALRSYVFEHENAMSPS